jgi:hypothetical protein
MSDLQRREFLTGAAVFAPATTATLAVTGRAAADDQPPRPIRGDKGASIIGPTNPSREAQSRDRLAPPPTDHGTIRNLRFSFSDVHNRLQRGGWARQVALREMPIATDLAIVNMRLKAGAIRELHWHNETEWGFVLKGQKRITAIDEEGHAFHRTTSARGTSGTSPLASPTRSKDCKAAAVSSFSSSSTAISTRTRLIS